MRILIFITLFISSYFSFGQGLEPSQIQGAPRLNDILQAKNMYIDEYGDTLYIYQHTSLDGLTTTYDSIYVSNDSIRLKYGSGFVKIPKLKAGQTTTIQTLITAGDTLYAGVNANSLDSTHIKAGGVARNDLSIPVVSSVTATSPLFSSGGLNPNITIQNGSGSQSGAITSTDWNYFDSKVNGTGIADQITFWGNSTSITSTSALRRTGDNRLINTGPIEINTGDAFKGFTRSISGLGHGVTNKMPTDMAWGMTDYGSSLFPNFFYVWRRQR